MVSTQITHQRILLRIGIITLILLHSAAGKLEIHRIDSPVEALLGDNTTLPCLFYGYKASPLDLSMVSVRWTLRTLEGEEKPVYLFLGGNHIQTRPGSYIPHSGLAGGDGSLYIPNIQSSDEGEYTCSVFVTPENAISKVTMEGSAIPTCTVSDSRLEMTPDTERSVTCYVSGFYPEHVAIHWVKYSKSTTNKSELDSRTCTSIPVQNRDGTYNVTSVLTVRPMSTDEDGDLYSCVILHRSLKDDGLTRNVTISLQPVPDNIAAQIIGIVFAILIIPLLVILFGICRIYFRKAPPEVLDIVGPELTHGKKTTLAYPVVNFSPKNIAFSLYLNEVNVENLEDSWPNENKEGDEQDQLLRSPLMLKPYITSKNNISQCICSISITPDLNIHNGAKLILEVHHKALKDPIQKELILRVTAAPVLDPIEANQESYNVRDHLELRCKIHSFYPRYINVIWYKGEETLLSTNSGTQKDGDGFFVVTSSVRATVIEEDFGEMFRCKVEHPGTPDEDNGVTWTLQRQGDQS